MTRVVVIDYGMGNLHSVGKALESVADSERVIISSDKEQLKQADKIIFLVRRYQGLYGSSFPRFKRNSS